MNDQDYMDNLYHLQRQRRLNNRIKFLLRTYSSVGVLLAIVAGAYFLLTLFPFDLSMQQILALMGAGTGILLSLMSRTLIVFYRERAALDIEREEESEKLAFFLNAWAQFEHVSKEVLLEQADDLNIHSLRSVISRLYAEGKIDKQDLSLLESGLKMRNAIVHGKHPMPARTTEDLTASLVELTRKILTPAQHA